MTKKHFEAIAAVLAETMSHETNDGAYPDETAIRTITFIANRLANLCAAENPNFDRARFLRACGV
jgi:hypothetical protein